MVKEEHLTHAERFRFIELCAFWEGRVNVKQLAAEYQLSRQQASKIFSDYRQLHPTQLHYSLQRKTYLATSSFHPIYISGNSNEYLSWLLGRPRQHLPLQRVMAPARHISNTILRPIVQALTQGIAVDIVYEALQGGREERLIAPCQLVYAAGRWHVRAWCFLREQYRDFVLSRLSDAVLDESKTGPASTEDVAWHTDVQLIFAPDPRLSATHRHVLEQEYDMERGQLVVLTRAALANYVIQEMGINTLFLAAEPEAQQLVLVNKHDIEQWLYS